jgi:hypothetical protein
MRKIAGERCFQDALSHLPETVRREYEETGLLSWCRQSTVRSATAAIARELERDPVEFAGHVVETSVADTFRGVWSIFLKHTDDASLLKRASVVFEKCFDRGTFEVSLVSDGTARITVRGWQKPTEMDVYSIGRGIEAILRAAKRVEPKVVGKMEVGQIVYTVTLG